MKIYSQNNIATHLSNFMIHVCEFEFQQGRRSGEDEGSRLLFFFVWGDEYLIISLLKMSMKFIIII